VGEIAEVGRRGWESLEEAAVAVRALSRDRLGDLARALECPFGWDDLVLPGHLREVLADFVFEAEARATFWEDPRARRLFPNGQGLFALFAGPPGTGKTMAAQVIAARLGLDLFRISIPSVVSKWVGDTSKNIQSIFTRAEQMHAVLLFDEADALFGKRTEIKDAHDRFANTETNHLLMAVEAYGGVVLLATNRKANVDPAFLRRLRYVVDFPRPSPAERRLLWKKLLAELAGPEQEAALSETVDALSESVDATGAQIKFAVLTALFAARREGSALRPAHVVRGLERELVKEGRALSQRDRERVLAG
jgi:SpoVK/Ycf46/Vps4 family AAA+-type ATPase